MSKVLLEIRSQAYACFVVVFALRFPFETNLSVRVFYKPFHVSPRKVMSMTKGLQR